MSPTKLIPWVAGALALGAVAVAALPQRPVNGFDVEAFGHLPILEGGRVKPVDSVARNSLLMIRSQQTFRFDPDGEAGPLPAHSVGPDEWLLDVLFRPDLADRQPIFVINDPEVLGLMGLAQRADRYYSFQDLAPHLDEIQKQAMAAQRKDAKERSRFEGAISNLFERIYLYYRLKNTVQLQGSPGLQAELAAATGGGAAARHAALAETAVFRILPPAAGAPREAWRSSGEALAEAATGQGDPALEPWARLGGAWAAQDAAGFGTALAGLHALETERAPAAVRQGDHEIAFNRAQPFYLGMVIYVVALMALFVSWLWKPQLFRAAAYGLIVAGALVHTGGLVSRIVLQGRPPVTNLYSSAVFVGWVAVVLALVVERIYRNGLGTAVAGVAGFASLIVAHHLTGDGDTMEMMRAVLDSNFWLATHVVTITIGYGGTFVAGIVAIGWTIWRHVTGGRDAATGRMLVSAAYGIICFALLFSFVGTVLGGIWADQSWGRFWGWDPKENGALLIVLWNAVILHARWGGYARDRGTMAMAIGGNIITSLSWFGVNMLGVGLHSYGFMDKAFWALLAFGLTQVALIGLALLPPQFWRASAWASAPDATGRAEGA